MDPIKALKRAIRNCNVDEVRKALLLRGADPIGVFGNKDGTPLHQASIYGNTEIMKELLKRNADVDSKNRDGQTPLVSLMSEMLSKTADWTRRAKLLINHGADIGIKDNKRCTAGDYLLSYMRCKHQASSAGRRDKTSDIEMIKEFRLLQKLRQLSEEDLNLMVMTVIIDDSERAERISEKLQSVSGRSAWDELEDVEMDPAVESLYSSIKGRKSKRYCLQFHVVGHLGAGKTSLIRQILKEEIHPEDVKATDCVDVHVGKCDVDLDSEEWHRNRSSSVEERRLDGVIDSVIKTDIVKKTNISTGADDTVETDSGPTLLESAADVYQSESSSTLPAVKQDPHLKEFCHKVQKKKSSGSGSRRVLVRAVDFGGHCMFYTTHQIFLTSRGINIIVIDITRRLDDLVEDDDFRHLGVQQKAKVQDFIKFWVKTLKHFTEGAHKRIFIVATHKDKAKKEEVNKRIEDIEKLLLDSGMGQFVVQEIFCVNCYNSNDTEMIKLRKELVKTAKMDTENWGKEVPTQWLILEDRIFNEERKQVMTFEEINKINQQSRNILDKEELKNFLCFHHTIGTLLYYHDYGIKDLVVLDPQWIIDSLKKIITIEKNDLKPHLFPYRDGLNENGLLKREFVQEVWKCGKQSIYFKHQDKLLSLFEKLNIITPFKMYDSSGNLDRSMPDYIVPCMLKPAPGHFLPTWTSKATISSSLAFYFNEIDFLPVIFHRLLASCLANLQSKSYLDYRDVYCDKAVFRFSGNHYLLLRYNNKSIVANIVGKSYESINPEVGFNARQFLTENLHGILGNKKKDMRITVLCERIVDDDTDKGIFDFKELEEAHERTTIKCTCSDHDINVKEILMFWKRDIEKTNIKYISTTATPPDPNMILNPRLLGRASRCIDPKSLHLLATTLKVETISAIELDHIKAYDKMYHMLYDWLSRKKGATLKNLIDAVEETGEKLDTEKLNSANITWREDIPTEVLQKTVTDRDIDTELCRVTGPIFFRLGIELDVDHIDLENIMHSDHKSQERARQMLHMWLKSKKDSASYLTFGDAAIVVGLGEATVQDLVDVKYKT